MPSVNAPQPLAAIPSKRQIKWHELEFYGFIHFTLNAWTGKEWGYGDESPSLFDPKKLDCAQWAETAKAAGMKGLILTTKHHDGFCLFPSKTTEHSVKSSPWRNGKGDVLKEFVKACEDAKLKAGFYISPWDRNHAAYGTPAYLDCYRTQLREVLGGYGEAFEVWFDGANGGDGYYGGAREKRKIDASTYYDWPNTLPIVRELQPDACVFSDGGPDIRWVGNENGECVEGSWQTFDVSKRYPGAPGSEGFALGERDALGWCPPECDVSIRPGWFHHDEEDSKVRPPENLLDLYFKSVGMGASFLLNLPPTRKGLVHENDIASLKGFRKLLDQGLSQDFAKGAKASASNVRGGDGSFGAEKAVDGSRGSYWACDDGVCKAELTLELAAPSKFNVVSLREPIALGQRIEEFKVEALCGDYWRTIASGTSVGSKRMIRIPAVMATKLKLSVKKARGCVCLSELALHLFPL